MVHPRVILWLNFIDANFSIFTRVAWNGEIIPIPFRHEDPGLRAKGSWNPCEQGIVIRILLFKNVHIFIARQINEFVLHIIHCIVHRVGGRKFGNESTIVRA